MTLICTECNSLVSLPYWGKYFPIKHHVWLIYSVKEKSERDNKVKVIHLSPAAKINYYWYSLNAHEKMLGWFYLMYSMGLSFKSYTFIDLSGKSYDNIKTIDFLKLDDKFSIIVKLLLRRRACMPKWMKRCKNGGFIGLKIIKFAVNGINFERRLYYWLWNLTTTLNLSPSFKKSTELCVVTTTF